VAVAYALIAAGRPAAARPILERNLRLALDLESLALAVESLAALGIVRAEVDRATAARIFAAAETIADQSGHPLSIQYQRGLVEEAARSVRDGLAERFGSEWEAGKALTLEEAVALALGEER
jgi:hypothetical protein